MPILKKNLSNLKSIKNYKVIERDIYEDNELFFFNKKFDIIFLDPPYKDKNLDKLLLKIQNAKIIKEKGIIILHRHRNEIDNLPTNFKIIEEKKYGISKIFLTI